jgi:hypothetical protein
MHSKALICVVFGSILAYASCCEVKATSFTTEGKKLRKTDFEREIFHVYIFSVQMIW